jgi:hypothetical protein
MSDKKTHAMVLLLTLKDLGETFSLLSYLPQGTTEIDVTSKYLNRDIIFGDNHLEHEICTSEAPELTDGHKYAGLLELVAYVKTKRGNKRTIHHQIVARKTFTVNGKKYFTAVGRLSTELVLFFIPVGKKHVWPKSAVFLTYVATKP